MRRKVQRSCNQLIIFCGILCLILFLNRPQSTAGRIFAWTKIHYRSTATTLPEARGLCPGLRDSTKPALVVSRVAADGDTTWLHALATRYHLCIYNVDAPLDASSSYLQVPANRGHEAMAYLTFLIDNYDTIPAVGAVFVHGSRFAWHNDAPDYDNSALLAALDVSGALAPWGYHNLRCDWSAGTCLSSVPAQGSLEMRLTSALEPWSARAASDTALPRVLAELFGSEDEMDSSPQILHLRRTETVRAQCCAQFVVSRERILQHTRDEYIALRQWLLDGMEDSQSRNRKAAPQDDRGAGRIVSYLWHILFAEQSPAGGIDLEALNSRACPRADECYCRLYGRCNLDHCSSAAGCRGQYQIPPNFRLADDWAERHSS